MHVKVKYEFPDSNEYEYKWAGRYGAPGERRAKREKATPEQIQKQNQKLRETKMRRLIKANFTRDDFWMTLKYKKGERPPISQVRKDVKDLLNQMRKVYKARGEQFKFIYRMEVGSRGGVHVHILMNRIGGEPATDLLVSRAWKSGAVNYEHLHGGDYQRLADYIVKPPSPEAQKHIDAMPEEERKEFIKYSSSRNLVRPVPKEKKYKRSVRKLVTEGPKPSKGFYIDKESIVTGVNPFTGQSYMYYTEIKIPPGGAPPGRSKGD